jgi:hypothetical protein
MRAGKGFMPKFHDMKVQSAGADVSSSKRPMKQPGRLRGVPRGARWSRTLVCAFSIVVLLGTGTWLCIFGESFFSLTRRLPAEVLVVEGWIGNDGIQAAAAEFERGGYECILTTGGMTDDRQSPLNYADLAGHELIRFGIPRARIIFAPTGEIEHERTFKSAVSTWRALQKRGIHPKAINVLTLGSHARRSRLVYAKVYAPATRVGVIAWGPAYYKTQPWWQSYGRSKCFFKEIVGYPFEVLLNSGRFSNSPG